MRSVFLFSWKNLPMVNGENDLGWSRRAEEGPTLINGAALRVITLIRERTRGRAVHNSGGREGCERERNQETEASLDS